MFQRLTFNLGRRLTVGHGTPSFSVTSLTANYVLEEILEVFLICETWVCLTVNLKSLFSELLSVVLSSSFDWKVFRP